MNTFLKAAVVAAALFAGANSLVAAPAESNLMPSCTGSTFTPHGVWDCR